MNESWRKVGYCGLYCGECQTYKGRVITRLSRDIKELIEAAHHPEWVPHFGGINFDYNEFLKGLEYYTKETSGCFNLGACKEGCGTPNCTIDDCAKDRGVELCFNCDEFPCNRFTNILNVYPDFMEEYEDYKKDKSSWLSKHVEKAEKGFVRNTNKYYPPSKTEN